MPTIKQILLWLNIYGGSFSAISVLVAVATFFIALGLQRKRHINNQLGLLKSLICELNYLGGEGEMQIGPLSRHSHLHWYDVASPSHYSLVTRFIILYRGIFYLLHFRISKISLSYNPLLKNLHVCLFCCQSA